MKITTSDSKVNPLGSLNFSNIYKSISSHQPLQIAQLVRPARYIDDSVCYIPFQWKDSIMFCHSCGLVASSFGSLSSRNSTASVLNDRNLELRKSEIVNAFIENKVVFSSSGISPLVLASAKTQKVEGRPPVVGIL